jgi:ATP-dependent helicase HrpA
VVSNLTGVRVPQDEWSTDQLPDHLRIRYEVVGPEGNVLASGRDIETLRPLAAEKHEDRLWREARKTWERDELSGPDFGDLPQSIEIGADAMGIQRLAYPGLADEERKVAVRLFADPGGARESTRRGLMRLYRNAFAAELKGFRKDWAFPDSFAPMVFFMGGIKEASSALYDYILRCLFGLESAQGPDRERFLANLEKLKGRLGVFGSEIRAPALEAVRQRHETRAVVDRFIRMAGTNRAVIDRMGVISSEIAALMPPDFLSNTGDRQMRLLPRYLRALRIRGERAYASPEKDRAKESQVSVFRLQLDDIRKRVLSRPTRDGIDFVEDLTQMIEEFSISLFAPEIKTLFPISGKRIEKKLQGLPL